MNAASYAEVKEGQDLPTFVRVTDFMHWNRYASVNDEFVYIHMDDEAGRKVGQKAAFGMGNLQVSYLHNLLRQWIGDDGWIKKFSCQFRAMNFKNDTITARGRVVKKYEQNGERMVDLDLWTENQSGQQLCPAKATVALVK